RNELQAALEKFFGKPAEPKMAFNLLKQPADQRQQLSLLLFGDEQARDDKAIQARLKEGGRVYRLQCMQCHGLTGDGRGPTAKWVNPHPRDYRPGVFKFLSV